MEIEVVYFLGSGASKAFYPSLPLASEMTLDYLVDPCGMVRPDQNIENVEAYLATQHWPKDKRRLTFEEVYSCFPEATPPFRPRENLLLCLIDRLRLPVKDDGYDPTFSHWIEGALKSAHPVITTNYDSVVEWYLAGLPTGEEADGLVDYGVQQNLCLPLGNIPSRTIPRRSALLLLKLYGSITWSHCRSCGKYLLETLHQGEAANTSRGKGKCLGCGEGFRREAVFVPLVGQKNPADLALQSIWERAEQVLCHARKIVFSGFSLRPGDQSVRDLLARACKSEKTEKVVVVLDENNEEIVRRYREIYDERVEEPYIYGWKQFLEEHAPNNFHSSSW